jgi:putative membrane protein
MTISCRLDWFQMRNLFQRRVIIVRPGEAWPLLAIQISVCGPGVTLSRRCVADVSAEPFCDDAHDTTTRALPGVGGGYGRPAFSEIPEKLSRDPSTFGKMCHCLALRVDLSTMRAIRDYQPMSTLIAFLHHLCAFTLVSAVAIEFTLIRQELTVALARRLQVTDLVLGVAAGALFIVGLLRVFYFEKGASYYFHSHAFLTKLSLFIIVGLLSIIPTMEFLSWRDAIKAGQVPVMDAGKRRRVTAVLHAELAAIVVILLCAAIMARGGWV